MTIMMIDWICIMPLSLDPVAEFDIPQRQREERNRDYDKYQVLHVQLLTGVSLPRPLFAAVPPDDSDGCRVLVLGENVLRAGQENGLIRPIAPVFVLHFKSIRQGKVIGGCDFLQRLGDSTEQAAAIGEILSARADVGS